MRRSIAAVVISGLVVAGCGTIGAGSDGSALSIVPRQQATNTGADRFSNPYIAALAAGPISSDLGEGLSGRDRRRALEAEYRALEYGQAGDKVAWKGVEPGIHGEVVAAQPYRVGSQDCRLYQHTVFREDKLKTVRATACREADGTWSPLT